MVVIVVAGYNSLLWLLRLLYIPYRLIYLLKVTGEILVYQVPKNCWSGRTNDVWRSPRTWQVWDLLDMNPEKKSEIDG